MSLSVEDVLERLNAIPRIRIAYLPTPLVHAPRLGEALGGLELYVKREDLTGIAFGGNKVRQCEFRLAPALAQGADTIITGGSLTPNNLTVQTAAVARALGLDVHLVFRSDDQVDQHLAAPQGNRLVEWLMGASVSVMHGDVTHQIAAMKRLATSLRARGRRPFLTGLEDSSLAAIAYVACYLELREQLASLHEQKPPTLVVGSGGATAAGLYLGISLLGDAARVLAVNPGYYPVLGAPKLTRTQITMIVQEAAALLGATVDPSPELLETVTLDSHDPDFKRLGGMRLTAENEGLVLDPIYTGAAMQVLLDRVRTDALGRGSCVVFFHTGGTASLFNYASCLVKLDPPPFGIADGSARRTGDPE